jgi:hypothetical protein
LLDPFHQRLRRVVEQKVRLVEEEDESRPLGIAHFREVLEQLRHQPQEEGRVETRIHHQPVGGEYADRPASVAGGAHQVRDLQRRFAEEVACALLFEDQQGALDRADGLARDIAVAHADLVGALGNVGQQRLQVLHVEQQKAFLVGDSEGDVHHALLRLGKVHEPGQKQRAHLRDRCADGMALLAEQVPENDRKLLEVVGVELHRLGPGL